MGSMNWLGFSLSPQELPNSQAHHEISGTDVSAGNCYDLISSHTPGQPGLNLPASYGLLEAFNRDSHSQDWNLKATLGTNSMLVGGTVATTTTTTRAPPTPACNQEPKLENFLGSIHSIRDAPSYDHHHHTNNGDYMFSNCSLQLPSSNLATNLINPRNSSTADNNSTDNNGVNVSLIKTWLRNQPTTGSKNDVASLQGGGLSSAQTLSLSMTSSGTETAQGLPLLVAGGGGGGASESSLSDNNSNKQQSDSTNGISTGVDAQSGAIEAVPRKSIDTFGQRTSIYRGVTRHRWTGRYEAHLWDNSCRREGQTRKGRQVYLGGYDKEDKAARSYDLAALKYWGTTTTTNFPISNYEKEIEEMKHMTRQEYVASLRRKSSGFSRGASIYRGVTRHHQHGRWQARIGRVAGNKDLYLGTFSTQEEAAEAYDIAAIKFRGLNAVTNFEINRYDVKAILESSTLPIGGAGKRLKEVEELTGSDMHRLTGEKNAVSQLSGGGYHTGWPAIAFQQAQPLSMQYQYNQQQRLAWCKQEQECDTTTQNSFQDLHQLQLGNTHNFFHQPSYNLMGMDSSSMEHSSGSNSIIYGGGGGDGGGSGGYGTNNGGYAMPSASLIGHEVDHGLGESDQVKQIGYENMYGSANMYYLSQQASGGVVKGTGGYDHQGSGCNNWISTVVPAMAPRSSNMAVCHGAPTFTVWNDT